MMAHGNALQLQIARIGLYETEYGSPPARLCYGIGLWLKRFLRIPEWVPLHVHMDHGVPWTDEILKCEVNTDEPVLVNRKSRQAELRKLSGKNSYVVGSPFVYCRWLLGIERQPDAKGTVAFPFHSTHLIDAVLDWDKYADALAALPQRFHPVTVCLYWKDLVAGHGRPFLERGIQVTTAGHMADPDFTLNFYNILKSCEFATSNYLGSYTFYSVEMGVPFFLHGEVPMLNNWGGDCNRPAGVYSMNPPRSAVTMGLRQDFAFDLTSPPVIRAGVREKVLNLMGLDVPIPKWTVRRVILSSALRHVWRAWSLRWVNKLRALRRVTAGLWGHGVRDLVRHPSAARQYWQRLARTMAGPVTSSGTTSVAKGMPLPVGAGLRTVALEELVPDAKRLPVSLVDYRCVDGDMPMEEILVLSRIIRGRNPRKIFEIGTFEGGTTLQMAVNCEAEISTLDLDPKSPESRVVKDATLDVYPRVPGCRFAQTPYAARITQLLGDSQRFDFGPYEGRMDLVLVDACHHYEWVRRDSENALRMVAPGGMVLWHDYATYAPGVMQALNELGSSVSLKHIADTSLVVYQSPAAAK